MSENLISDDLPQDNNNTEQVAQDTATVSQESASVDTDWRSNLPEDLRNHSSLQDIKDLGNLAKSYINAQSALGGRIKIPTEDSSPEDKAAFFKRIQEVKGVYKMPETDEERESFYSMLGRPESADSYKVETDLDISKYKSVAHKLGLTNDQFAGLISEFTKNTHSEIEQMDAVFTGSLTKLKDDWGNEFDNHLKVGNQAFKQLANEFPDEAELLKGSFVSKSPMFIKLLAEYGKSLQEKGVVNPSAGATPFGETPESAREKIAEINANLSHPAHAHNASAETHREQKARLDRLYSIAYPNG